ncbi:unnamed protein product, partial [Mesorhabditis spiculigera]
MRMPMPPVTTTTAAPDTTTTLDNQAGTDATTTTGTEATTTTGTTTTVCSMCPDMTITAPASATYNFDTNGCRVATLSGCATYRTQVGITRTPLSSPVTCKETASAPRWYTASIQNSATVQCAS